jgi:hypothetical protein
MSLLSSYAKKLARKAWEGYRPQAIAALADLGLPEAHMARVMAWLDRVVAKLIDRI